MTEREISAKDVQHAYEWAANCAVESFNDDGFAAQQLFSVQLAKDADGPMKIVAFSPMLMKLFYADDRGKDMLGYFIRASLTRGTPIRAAMMDFHVPPPDMIVQVSEAWMLKLDKADEMKRDRKKSIEHTPGRVECILVNVHTRDGTVGGFCPILENPRRAEYAPFINEAGMKLSGRLTMTPDGDL